MRFSLFGLFAIVLMLSGCGSDNKAIRKAKIKTFSKAYKLARKGDAVALKAFLKKNPEMVNYTSKSGESTLLEIVVDISPPFPNMYNSMKVLLDAGADPNANAPKILRKAIWQRDPKSLQILLDYGGDPLKVWKRKNINMLEYARSHIQDDRVNAVIDAWEEKQEE